MGKYEDLTKNFYEDYEEPVIEEYIVGFSGLDPDKKVRPELIDHEKLDGLLGGDFAGRYHLTNEQVRKLEGYAGQIEEVQREAEEKITELRRQAEAEISSIDAEIDETRTELDGRMSNLEESQEGLEAEQETISTRFEQVLGSVTEDYEILDARLDAEYESYPNLGSNIRHIHRQLLETNGETRKREREIYGHFQEQADELSGAVLRNEFDILEERKKRESTDALLSETNAHIDELSEALSDETAYRKSDTAYLTGEIAAEERERIAFDQALRDDMLAESQERQKADETLRSEISASRKQTATRSEHLQAQADDLAGAILTERFARQAENQKLKDRISHWEQKSREVGEHISEQLSDLSSGVMRNALSVKEAADTATAREKQTAREIEKLRENVDTNAYTLMDLAVQLSRKSTGGSQYVNPLDWSQAMSIAIPEPRCAVVNITGINAMPTSKTEELDAVMEFWDMAGNYFRKNITCSAQGNYSMNYEKKNVKFDLLNEDGSEFEMKIGDWVSQDGFHLKAYYTDFFRGIAVVNYKFWDEIMRFNGLFKDRPYKKALIKYANIREIDSSIGNIGDISLQLDNGALCHPDGFPCLVYLNGEFYGIFSWQLKKHRKNYHMEKSTVEHIHLDGLRNAVYFWNGTINWTRFEIRNPNKLYTMDGKKYDGDAPKELIDETSAKYDPNNKDHVRSAKVKRYIQALVHGFGELKTLYTAYTRSPTAVNLSAVRAKYEELFDWENIRDYLIFSDIIRNIDGIENNCQWTTYDGVKWYANAYDLDITFRSSPLTNHLTTDTAYPFYYVALLYGTELEARYAELREAGIINTEHIVSMLKDWCARIGTVNYDLEYKRWSQSTHTDSIYRVKKWLEIEIKNMDTVYHYVPKEAEKKAIEERIQATREEISQEHRMRYRCVRGLQEQVNELAYLKLDGLMKERELEKRLAGIDESIEEILDGGALEYEGAAVSRNSEVADMMEDVFNGDGSGGEAISEIPEALKDKVTTPEEFDDMLSDVFG